MLYYNNYPAEVLLNTVRKSILFFSTLFIPFFFLLTKRSFGIVAGIVACLLYSFNTSIAAHSCLVTQDILASLFYFLAFYFFVEFLENKKFLILCAIATGLLSVTKYSVVVLWFTYFVFLLYLYIIKKLKLNDILLFAFYQILSIVVIAGVIYNKSFNELIDGFIKILSYTAFEGRPTFFFGRYSNKGFLLYFPSLVLFKTELPILLLFILSILKTFYDVFKNKSLNKDTMLTYNYRNFFILSCRFFLKDANRS